MLLRNFQAVSVMDVAIGLPGWVWMVLDNLETPSSEILWFWVTNAYKLNKPEQLNQVQQIDSSY